MGSGYIASNKKAKQCNVRWWRMHTFDHNILLKCLFCIYSNKITFVNFKCQLYPCRCKSKYYTIKNKHIFVNCHSILNCSTAPPLDICLPICPPMFLCLLHLVVSTWACEGGQKSLCVELVSVGCWVKEEARHTMCGRGTEL